MAADIGARIGIEGEANFRNQMKQITAQSKALASEMKVVESSFDAETTAQDKAAKRAEVLNKQIDTQKQKVALLADELEKSKQKYGENATQTLDLQDKLNKATAALNNMERDLSDTEKAADGYGEEAQDATKGTQEFDAAALALSKQQLAEWWGKVAEQAKKVAESAFSAAKELDKGYDTIVKKTGATGEALEGFKDIADSVYKSMPSTMEDVGSAVGEVNTRLGLTGEALEDASRLFLEFAHINDTDVSTSVDTVQKALAAFGLGAEDTARILDVMTAAGQASGVGMNELASAMVKNAGALTELGLSAEESIMFIGRLEKSGVDSETALSGMSRALKSATKQGIPLNEALSKLEDTIVNGTDSMDGLSTAYDLFGKSGDKIYNALKTGSISFKNLTEDVKDYSGTVTKTYEATISPWDKTAVAMNNLKTVGSELAGQALQTLVPAIEKVTEIVQKVADWFGKLSPTAQKVVGIVTALGAGAAFLAPKLMSVVQTLSMIKTAAATAKAMSSLTNATEGATTAQKAFNVAVLANPIVAITTGIIAATVALGALAFKLADASAESEAFKASASAIASAAKENSSAVQEMADSAAASVAEMQAQEQITDELVGTVETLSKKENKSADEVKKLHDAVRQLNQIYPELNLQYDEAADSLNMTNRELEDNIKLTQDQAKAMAYAKIYNELLEQQLQLQIDQAAIQNQQNAMVNDNLDLLEAFNSRGALANIIRMDEFKTVSTLNDGMKDLNSAYDANEQAMASSTAQMQVIEEAMAELGFAVDPVTGKFEGLATAEGEAADGAEDAGTAMQGASEAITNSTAAVDSAIPSWNSLSAEQRATADKVAQAYRDMEAAVTNSINSQMSMFEEFNGGAEVSTDELLKNMQSQIDGVTNWETNLTTLADRGINQGMLQYLLEMGPKGANYVQAFVNMSDKEFARANELWEQSADIKGLTNDIGRDLKSGLANVAGSMDDTGLNIGLGLARGITSAKGAVIAAAKEMARSTRATVENELRISSPSKVFKWIGEMTGEGFAIGLEETMPNLGSILSPLNDVDMFSGRGVNALDTDSIYSAVRAGAENAQTKIVIGEKEFGRLMRGMGVSFA